MAIGKMILKLLGDRLLFIVASLIFLFPMTAMMTWMFPWSSMVQVIVYSLLMAIPYVSLLYNEMWHMGKLDRYVPQPNRAVCVIAVNEIGVVLCLLAMAIVPLFCHTLSTLLARFAYSLWTAPFSAANCLMLLSHKDYTLPLAWWIVPLVTEITVCFCAYMLGLHEWTFTNAFRKILGLKPIEKK